MSWAASVLFWILVCVICGCAGCTHRPEHEDESRTFLVSSEFTPEERAALERAVERWNKIATAQLTLRQGVEDIEPSTSSHVIFRIPNKGEYWHRVSESLGGIEFIGVYWEDPDVIGIVDSMPIDQFERVALHEIGHAHGLEHIEGPAIMCAYDGTASDFTEKDIAECKRAEACKEDVR